VRPLSAAAKAGIQSGDAIVSVNGRTDFTSARAASNLRQTTGKVDYAGARSPDTDLLADLNIALDLLEKAFREDRHPAFHADDEEPTSSSGAGAGAGAGAGITFRINGGANRPRTDLFAHDFASKLASGAANTATASKSTPPQQPHTSIVLPPTTITSSTAVANGCVTFLQPNTFGKQSFSPVIADEVLVVQSDQTCCSCGKVSPMSADMSWVCTRQLTHWCCTGCPLNLRCTVLHPPVSLSEKRSAKKQVQSNLPLATAASAPIDKPFILQTGNVGDEAQCAVWLTIVRNPIAARAPEQQQQQHDELLGNQGHDHQQRSNLHAVEQPRGTWTSAGADGAGGAGGVGAGANGGKLGWKAVSQSEAAAVAEAYVAPGTHNLIALGYTKPKKAKTLMLINSYYPTKSKLDGNGILFAAGHKQSQQEKKDVKKDRKAGFIAVDKVRSGSDAERAGLQKGDKIVRINNWWAQSQPLPAHTQHDEFNQKLRQLAENSKSQSNPHKMWSAFGIKLLLSVGRTFSIDVISSKTGPSIDVKGICSVCGKNVMETDKKQLGAYGYRHKKCHMAQQKKPTAVVKSAEAAEFYIEKMRGYSRAVSIAWPRKEQAFKKHMMNNVFTGLGLGLGTAHLLWNWHVSTNLVLVQGGNATRWSSGSLGESVFGGAQVYMHRP
jgi:membrane-associated protease RseP (regulator of RpoE activity)